MDAELTGLWDIRRYYFKYKVHFNQLQNQLIDGIVNNKKRRKEKRILVKRWLLEDLEAFDFHPEERMNLIFISSCYTAVHSNL